MEIRALCPRIALTLTLVSREGRTKGRRKDEGDFVVVMKGSQMVNWQSGRV